MRKKERIYAKDKTIRYKNKNNENGSFSSFEEGLLTMLSLEETLWGKFTLDVFVNNQKINLEPKENVKNIFYELPNQQIQTVIFNNVFSIENYNPYIDKFPLEKIHKQYHKIILKKQKFIEENYDYWKIIDKNNYKTYCQYNKNNGELKYLLESIDIVILFNSYSFFIATKEKIDLTPIFDYLDNFEKDKWIIDDKKKRICLKKGKKTQINIKYKIEDLIGLLPIKRENFI